MPTEQAVNPLAQMIVPYALIFAIFWFLIFKPQKDKQKQHAQMLKNLKKNDEVITTSGIHATVALVKETTVVLRLDDNVKVEFDKDSVAALKKASKE